MRLAFALLAVVSIAGPAQAQDWPAFGNDPGGSQFSSLDQINIKNVTKLKVAWINHSGEIGDYKTKGRRNQPRSRTNCRQRHALYLYIVRPCVGARSGNRQAEVGLRSL